MLIGLELITIIAGDSFRDFIPDIHHTEAAGPEEFTSHYVPLPIVFSRNFGHKLVGQYHPQTVPFGPFGFYANFFH